MFYIVITFFLLFRTDRWLSVFQFPLIRNFPSPLPNNTLLLIGNRFPSFKHFPPVHRILLSKN